MTGTASEIGFHMIPCAMQARAGQRDLFPRMFHVPTSIAKASEILDAGGQTQHPNASASVACADAELLAVLNELAAVLVDFKRIFHQVKTLVGVEEFYDIYRPLLGAFWPDGMWLEGCGGGEDGSSNGGGGGGTGGGSGEGSGEGTGGVSGGGESDGGSGRLLVKAKGPSAGQSTMFVVFDRFLGVHHGNRTSAGQFQDEMLAYMPPKHAQFARDLGSLLFKDGLPTSSSPREYVVRRRKENPGLQEAYAN